MQATQGGKDRKVRELRSWNPGREIESRPLVTEAEEPRGGGISERKIRRWGSEKSKLLVRAQNWGKRTEAKIRKN